MPHAPGYLVLRLRRRPCAHNPEGRPQSWGVSVEELDREAIEAAKQLLSKGPVEVPRDRPSTCRNGADRPQRRPGADAGFAGLESRSPSALFRCRPITEMPPERPAPPTPSAAPRILECARCGAPGRAWCAGWPRGPSPDGGDTRGGRPPIREGYVRFIVCPFHGASMKSFLPASRHVTRPHRALNACMSTSTQETPS